MRLHASLVVLLCWAFTLPWVTANSDPIVVTAIKPIDPVAIKPIDPVTVRPIDHELFLAVSQGHTKRVLELLKTGANINFHQPPWQLTPLQVASDLNYDMVALLLEHGATVNVADRDGVTPLMRAVDLRDLRMARLLLNSGAQVNAKDFRGHTALTRSVLRSDAVMLKLLIMRKADVDVVAEMGTTPWSIAQRMHHAALIMPDVKLDNAHMHMAKHAGHPMRDKEQSLIQTQAVLDVLAKAGVKRPQQEVKFDAMRYHHH